MKKDLSKPNRMNILVTGADGFIGTKLSAYLKDRYNVFNVVYKRSDADTKNSIRLDLENRRRVNSYFQKFKRKYKIQTIVHLASRMVPTSKAEDLGILYDNIKITEGTIEIAKLLKPKKIINFSSIAVYPNKDGRYDENSEIKASPNTDCLYGLSKFCSENMLDFMLRKEKIIIAHLRIAQVYGEGMRKDRIIPVMLKELQEKNTITVFGEGKRIINFIYVEKLLNIVNFFIEKDLSGIFNIGDQRLSLLELAKKLIKRYGDKKSKIIKKLNGSRTKFYLNIAKVKKLMTTDKDRRYHRGNFDEKRFCYSRSGRKS